MTELTQVLESISGSLKLIAGSLSSIAVAIWLILFVKDCSGPDLTNLETEIRSLRKR